MLVTVDVLNKNQAIIRWQIVNLPPPGYEIIRYDIYRREEGGVFSKIGESTTISYSDIRPNAFQGSVKYYYRVDCVQYKIPVGLLAVRMNSFIDEEVGCYRSAYASPPHVDLLNVRRNCFIDEEVGCYSTAYSPSPVPVGLLNIRLNSYMEEENGY